jgi:RNA recognition motif-containing protein
MATTKIFVGNVPPGTSSDDIQMLFTRYGSVVDCVVLGSFGFVVSIFMTGFDQHTSCITDSLQ